MVARSGVFSGAFWQIGVGEEAAKRDKSWFFVASPIGLALTPNPHHSHGARGFFRAKFCFGFASSFFPDRRQHLQERCRVAFAVRVVGVERRVLHGAGRQYFHQCAMRQFVRDQRQRDLGDA